MKWFIPAILFIVLSATIALMVRFYKAEDYLGLLSHWPTLLVAVASGLVGAWLSRFTTEEARAKRPRVQSEPIKSIWVAPITWVAVVMTAGITAIVQFL